MIDLTSVVPIARMQGHDDMETRDLHRLHDEATAYLKGFRWCSLVHESFFGGGVGGVVGIFLFHIVPLDDADPWIWVVAGDLPSAYFVTDDAPTPAAALDVYCALMRAWVDAVRSGAPLDDVYPVGVTPTPEHADLLEARLASLTHEIRPTLFK